LFRKVEGNHKNNHQQSSRLKPQDEYASGSDDSMANDAGVGGNIMQECEKCPPTLDRGRKASFGSQGSCMSRRGSEVSHCPSLPSPRTSIKVAYVHLQHSVPASSDSSYKCAEEVLGEIEANVVLASGDEARVFCIPALEGNGVSDSTEDALTSDPKNGASTDGVVSRAMPEDPSSHLPENKKLPSVCAGMAPRKSWPVTRSHDPQDFGSSPVKSTKFAMRTDWWRHTSMSRPSAIKTRKLLERNSQSPDSCQDCTPLLPKQAERSPQNVTCATICHQSSQETDMGVDERATAVDSNCGTKGDGRGHGKSDEKPCRRRLFAIKQADEGVPNSPALSSGHAFRSQLGRSRTSSDVDALTRRTEPPTPSSTKSCGASRGFRRPNFLADSLSSPPGGT